MIRIVGLSATLPNYLDVARFLRVNPYQGLFFFDARFRPVPLGQTFIGIKARSIMGQLQDMDTVCFDKVLDNVENGYQVCMHHFQSIDMLDDCSNSEQWTIRCQQLLNVFILSIHLGNGFCPCTKCHSENSNDVTRKSQEQWHHWFISV